MTARVAVIGDVTATASSGLPLVAAGGSGKWTAGQVGYTSYPKLKVGSAVIWKATCTFSFSGLNSGGSAVADSDTVTLTAGATKLARRQQNVLVHGENTTSAKGNRLTVSASRALKTA
jgi:hypothetical protein